jgi:hypothetical protein
MRHNNFTLIQCGHFALVPNISGDLVPAIHQDIIEPKLNRFVKNNYYMGNFPIESLRDGIEIALQSSEPVKFLFLVNDWQFTNLKWAGTKSYFQSATIPSTLLAELHNNGLDDKIYSNNFMGFDCLLLSENYLRKSFSKINNKEWDLNNSCAKEFFSLLFYLSNVNIRKFISLNPLPCKSAISYATDFFDDKFGSMDIINIPSGHCKL